MMRKSFGLLVCLIAVPTFAQKVQQKPTTSIQCRPINGSTTAIQSDEKVIGDQICRAVPVPESSASPNDAQMAPINKPESVPDPPPTRPASKPEVIPNSVYISPMNGFETYLAAAFSKKKVPLTVVADQARAQYVITGTSDEKKAGVAKMLIFGQIHSDDSASFQMADQTTGAVVFAYAVNKKNTLHGQQTTAEACAKHLKEQLEKEKR